MDERKLFHLRRVLVLLLLWVPVSCTAFYQPDPDSLDTRYRDQILEWQKRINEQGWTQNVMDDIVDRCILISKYRLEHPDHWATPREFIENGFTGDCEDIAFFAMGAFKRLQYPRGVRVLVVRTLTGDHALLKVEAADGSWKTYETVPVPLAEFDRLFYRPIVEFDETSIVYFRRQRS